MFSVEIDGITEEIFSTEALVDDLKLQLMLYAGEVLRDGIKEGLTNKDPVVAVDGSFKKNITEVKAFGKIEFFDTARDISESIIESFDEIEKRNPRGTKNRGDKFSSIKYKDHNFVYFNRKLVAQNRLELRRWLDFMNKIGFNKGDVIAFVNVVPYARKLERFGVLKGNQRFNTSKGQKSSARSVSIPNGVYATAQRPIKRIMKGKAFVAPVKFEQFNISVGGMRDTFAKANSTGGIGRPYLYPVIKIYPLAGGGVIQ